MNKILTMLCLLCTVSAYSQDDPKIWLTQDHIMGDWVLITSRPAPIPGYFEFDTTVFHVYTLNEQDKYTYLDILRASDKTPFLKKPIGMSIWSNRGKEIRSLLNDPQERQTIRNDYLISSLEYYAVYDYYGGVPSFKVVQFVMLREDCLEVTVGSSRYELRKGVVYVQESILP